MAAQEPGHLPVLGPDGQGQLLLHPEVGEITVQYRVMWIEGEGGLTLLTYHAAEGSPEYDAFFRLDS